MRPGFDCRLKKGGRMAEAVYRKGDIVELLITDMADKDECFGKLECGMGVMVGGMLAVGDRVSARITRVRQRYLKAIALEVLEPSLDRTETVCGDFGMCGGCKLMHIRYDAQLRYKEKKFTTPFCTSVDLRTLQCFRPLGPLPRFITETRLSSPVRASATFVLRSFQWMNY